MMAIKNEERAQRYSALSRAAMERRSAGLLDGESLEAAAHTDDHPDTDVATDESFLTHLAIYPHKDFQIIGSKKNIVRYLY